MSDHLIVVGAGPVGCVLATLLAKRGHRVEAYEKRPDIAARSELTADSGRLLLVLVGLPARGKSLLSHKLELFLAWRGWKTKAFSAGAKRRRLGRRESRDVAGVPEAGSSRNSYPASPGTARRPGAARGSPTTA